MSKKFCGPTQAEVTDLENGAHSDQEVHRANSSTYSNGRQVRDLTNEFHEPTGRVSSRTWWICGFLFLATVLNYLDRQVLSLTADRIIGEFGLTKEGFGKIIAAFRYSYGIFQIFGGFLVDAHGPRITYPVAGGLWSLAGMLTGLSSSVAMLSSFRFLLGVGEAFNWPCALKVTQGLLPPKDRPLANGIFNSGAAVGALLAPLIVTLVTVYYGWRAAFVITGALGGFWVVGWLWYTRASGDELKGIAFPFGTALRLTGHILGMRGFWMLAVSAIVINSANFYLADWIPLYLKSSRGFAFAAGNILSIAVYAGISSGNILVGLFVRKLVGKGLPVTLAKRRALLVSCVLMSMAVLAGFTSYRYVALVCLVLTGAGVGGFLVIYLTFVQDLDLAHVGVTSGLLGGLGNLAYGLCSPYIGRLSDIHETFLIFMFIGLLPWLAFFAILWGIKEMRP